ncbi:MAG TPA: diphthine--ammonia ligase [Clostridiaceae bacterium]|nr:diphthine--ammonia ligase [Clostridiaceae bacterium]
MNRNCFVSWSGGKDSCLAFYKAVRAGYSPKKLFTMFSKENDISTAHRLKEEVLRAQALAIGIEHTVGRALFNEYEEVFVHNIKQFKKEGLDYGIFGDIDIEEHKQWEEKVCKRASITAVLPLWQKNRRNLVQEFLNLGFKAKIIVVNTTMLDKRFLGQDLSFSLLDEIEKCGADVCGENGEYHTVVYDGPIFRQPVNLVFDNNIIPVEDNWAQIQVRQRS